MLSVSNILLTHLTGAVLQSIHPVSCACHHLALTQLVRNHLESHCSLAPRQNILGGKNNIIMITHLFGEAELDSQLEATSLNQLPEEFHSKAVDVKGEESLDHENYSFQLDCYHGERVISRGGGTHLWGCLD